MNYGRVLLPMSLVLLAGCQKSTVNQDLASTVDSASIKCEVSAADLSSADASGESLKIVGQSAVQSGNAVKFTLTDSGSCVNGQKVSWKAAGSSSVRTTSTGLTSVYNKAGSYVVTAQEKTTGTTDAPVVSFKTAVVSEEMMLSGPQAGFAFNNVSFSLVVPASITPSHISFDFGDATATVNDVPQATHVYFEPGVYQVKATVTEASGKVTTLSQRITIITLVDGMSCLQELAISGATEAKVKVATSLSVYIPPCLTDKIGAVRWTFGDNETGANQSVTHTYAAIGTYPVTATLYLGSSQEPWITLDHSIRVIENLVVDPEPPAPADPNSCTTQGATRESQSELYSETLACGIDGTKSVSYRDRVVEECKLVVEKLAWTEVSRTKEVTNEGPCEGQSCKLPDGSLLANGASKVLYSNAAPAGSCSTVSEQRTCNNGVLSGSSSSNQMTCHDGCGNFGSHGTVKIGVVTGETQVPLTCSFGEQGFFDVYTQISDQTCKDGSVSNSNTRQGTLKTPGQCPVYSYAPTDAFTACSADCGGKQSRIFVCRDDKGVQVDNARCQGSAMPVEERVCDGNPAAVRRQEVTTTSEEANSSKLCPKNQIGLIIKSRDVVNTKTYACIDHQVQLESNVSVPSPWVEESFCRDYVARRCSQDSLSNTEAKGRYDWMVKCQNQLPIIKDFLDNFNDVKVTLSGQQVSLGSAGRELYPTFMNFAFKPEKPWIAPKVKTAPCVMPETVYVATVCVSSCATPEQQILAQEKANGSLKYVPFIEALTKNMNFVASLQSAQSMGSKEVVKTKVDQWVTELIDTEHDILVFKMKSGRELKVTPNHPIVTSEGFMKTAAEFKAGESLVQLGGNLDPIVSITATKYFGKVYNVFVQSSAIHKNILVTNGYLNGSAYFQNAGVKDMNRSLFKQKLTSGVFSK
ncbi:PKD domain-containing protein [Bdellovibrio svalbardensis]|uniref:PKD domain-containing protein n=1 Tax=Bdellovibrio svalbardensis TaxID=2972972 RepID=A0ABT6DJ80_9BACT|nr:PKD domain-containing protein [Bdellovibrio svalbardensis]MDG0816853.1 PKD domain-containing protein [Bdellovibrio svalbardensis]